MKYSDHNDPFGAVCFVDVAGRIFTPQKSDIEAVGALGSVASIHVGVDPST